MEFNRKNMYKRLFNQTFEAQQQREYAIQRVLRIIDRLEINGLLPRNGLNRYVKGPLTYTGNVSNKQISLTLSLMAGVFLFGRFECFPCLVTGVEVALILLSLELPIPCIDINAVLQTIIRLLVSVKIAKK